MERTYQTAAPFFLPGTGELESTMILMVHGFTGSPSEFRRLGYYLNDQGYSVHALLLSGHGTTPEAMLQTRWKDWWGNVRDTFDQLKAQGYKRIIAVGHSMGGLLTLKLSMEVELDGLISVAAPIFLSNKKAALAILMQYFIKYTVKKPTVSLQLVEESCAYNKTPLCCVVSLQKLLKQVKRSLLKVRVPLLIVQGERDGTVQPRSAQYIYDNVGTSSKQLLWYAQSSHAILIDQEREQVFQDIHRFIQLSS